MEVVQSAKLLELVRFESYPQNNNMKFYAEEHKYIDENNDHYLSVTTLLHAFEPKKDWDKIASNFAKKHKRTKEDVQLEWKLNNEQATRRGTKYHDEQEKALLNSQGIVKDNYICEIAHCGTIDGVKEDLSIKLENNTIYPEKMIWSRKYKVCGTADIVEVVDGKINIKDYKTNKKLELESFNHHYFGKDKLNSPLMHLDACNFNLYQLQLNTYMFMLLQQNRHLKMGTMIILHIKFDEHDNAIETIEYPVADLQKEVKNMLEHYTNKKEIPFNFSQI